MASRWTNSVEEHGYALVRNVFSHSETRNLLNGLGAIEGAGKRGLLGVPQVGEVARSEKLVALVRPHTGNLARPVRAIYFDKSASANWLVAWHQDVTIAVEERVDVAGFCGWSVKARVPHVQAPAEVLTQMLAVRIHLDDCDARNGALRVLPGTHRLGWLSSEQIEQLRAEKQEVICCARAGDVLLMRPLLLHASGKSEGEGHRRVLHIEYAGVELAGGLRWRESEGNAPHSTRDESRFVD